MQNRTTKTTARVASNATKSKTSKGTCVAVSTKATTMKSSKTTASKLAPRRAVNAAKVT